MDVEILSLMEVAWSGRTEILPDARSLCCLDIDERVKLHSTASFKTSFGVFSSQTAVAVSGLE